ncbi:MAG TPA: hypothetical protein VMM13_07305 [Euzebya sp.]|nr:hypothetical protein [Euzebya sp.]
MPTPPARAGDSNDHGLLVGPAPEVTAHALAMDVHDDEVGDLLIALLGWDATVQHLAASTEDRAGQVLLSVISWLLLD